jgi:SPW repeat
MARETFFNRHRTWEDWVELSLGVLVMLSPWILNQSDHSSAVVNAALIGVALIVISGMELFRVYRWHEYASLVLGLWLLAAPSVLGYVSLVPLASWHYVLGAVVAGLAAFEIWQDWNLSDTDLERLSR